MNNVRPEETVGFRRRVELPGVEVRDVENSARRWRCFSTGFEFLAPRTWEGEVLHRRRQQRVGPGMVFCTYPEEVFTTPRVLAAGGGSAVTIDPEVFAALLAEHDLTPGTLDMTPFVTMSDTLSSRMATLFRLMRPETTPMELQSSLVDLAAALVGEAVAPGPAPAGDPDTGAADRVRECLRFDLHGAMDLERLARETRLSRFQVLRVFKHKYGLPPHAYQLRVRIGLAQRALRAGLPSADVAADHGFVDQSHFSRHFKQLVGVTPVAYARARGFVQ
jgi:AraC-like DNA-binding protein